MITKDVRDTLEKKSQWVSFAESCTGGLVSAELVALEGVSSVYQGSVVAYDNSVKTQLLRVSEDSLKEFGAVSEVVALEMAQGVRSLTKSDWAVSITGVAGPTGGTDTKPVGLVCFAVIGPNFEKTYREHFDGGRNEVQKQSAEFVWKKLYQAIKGE